MIEELKQVIPDCFTERDLRPYAAFLLTKSVGNLSNLSDEEQQLLASMLPDFLRTHIDKQTGKSLHILLGVHKIPDHNKYASERVDRIIQSFTQITYKEALLIRKELNNVQKST